jgi:hypothetical protein
MSKLQPAAAKMHVKENYQPSASENESPMGVAKYHTSVDMPEELRKALPDIDSLKRLLSESNNV